MHVDAGHPTKADLREGAPVQEPMRGQQPGVRRNPSTDQKKVRRKMQRKCAACAAPSAGCCDSCGCTLTSEAGVRTTDAERLLKGNVIRMPNGQHVRVMGPPRRHETSGNHVYIDTDIGTQLVHRNKQLNTLTGPEEGDEGPTDTRQTQPWRNPSANENPANFNQGQESLRQVRRQGDPRAVNPPKEREQFGPRGYRPVPVRMSRYHTVGGVSVIASRARTLAKEEDQ